MTSTQKALVAAVLTLGALGAAGGPALAVSRTAATAAPCEYTDPADCGIPPDPNMHWGNERPSN